MADLTPEERERIYQEEKARIEAREQIEANKKPKKLGCGTLLLGLIGIAVLVYVISSLQGTRPIHGKIAADPRMAASPRVATAEQEKNIREMVETKLIDKINADLNEAWINPARWVAMKFEDKRNLCRYIAEYIGAKKGTGLNWMEMYDTYSGKKLAKYSQTYGFKVY